jgi:molybdenum cofactor biosynthesis protein B
MGHEEHRRRAPVSARIGILSVSTTRSLVDDESGHWIAAQAITHGHEVVAHQVVTDDIDAIRRAAKAMLADTAPEAVIVTGGTGISPKDVTIEALQPLFSKELTGFGPLFTQLSFQEVQAAAMISRATAGIIDQSIFFCIPGSLKACHLACNALIFPELGHLMVHAFGE